ncbi:hypothetical protein LJ656_06620 [Paraburkholderia sp. MMS20-SJTR3]|uniref:Acetolactate synthase, small subunit n=1 Tax=Paraburkholderia sejongensis TaxID=2886946 RepID=A0ABS8JQS0_9BURK|nr:hypothetical protein [Paraburkholderia sp. MMS20-SJTR3]MCC8392258.1 hypothetical protein [Paraburkholderia sp. MMS20-SJTR3]
MRDDAMRPAGFTRRRAYLGVVDAMLLQLTIYHAGAPRLLALCRALELRGVRICGRIEQRSERHIDVRIVTSDSSTVSTVCRQLVECGLAQTVLAQRLDV